jgi:hypothetical protein
MPSMICTKKIRFLRKGAMSINLDYLLFLMLFFGGMDFTISGYIILKRGAVALSKPRLLGLRIFKRMQIPDNMSFKVDKFTRTFFSLRAMGYYGLIAGLLYLVGSVSIIFDLIASR